MVRMISVTSARVEETVAGHTRPLATTDRMARYIRPPYQPPSYKEPRPTGPLPEKGEAAWRCGHAKTPENTHGPYKSHSGQCASCWRWNRRKADDRRRWTMSPAQALAHRVSQEHSRRVRHIRQRRVQRAEIRGEEPVPPSEQEERRWAEQKALHQRIYQEEAARSFVPESSVGMGEEGGDG